MGNIFERREEGGGMYATIEVCVGGMFGVLVRRSRSFE